MKKLGLNDLIRMNALLTEMLMMNEMLERLKAAWWCRSGKQSATLLWSSHCLVKVLVNSAHAAHMLGYGSHK